MNPENVISRETYKSIKKMSRDELQAFLIRYANALKDDAPTLDLRLLESEIKAVKGIGEKRTEEIMVIIERHLGITE